MISFKKYSEEFTAKALNAGYSDDDINRCLLYGEPILRKRLPIIYNSSHFSALVGYNQKYIKRVVRTDSTKWFYRKFDIKKENGGFRTIQEPLPSLKEIQKWVLDNVLNKVPISPYAKAYTRKKNIRDHARYHRKQKIVVTMDIEKFFDRITRSEIDKIYRNLNYSDKVSELLSKICTLEDKLPQGAPTSPYLSNILLNEFDVKISKYCTSKNLKYTRYADDMAFSGNDIDLGELKDLIDIELKKVGLNLNEAKTVEMPLAKRQEISGIIVNEKIQVPRKKRDELRQAVYYIEKFGLENHLEKINCEKANYVKHLLGLANYILFINPKDERTKKIMVKLKKLYQNNI